MAQDDTTYVLSDGSAFSTASFPLPEDHWLYATNPNGPPMPWRMGIGPERDETTEKLRAAARYAIRASTARGRADDFDPDAMVQNFIIGMLGYWTEDGLPTAD